MEDKGMQRESEKSKQELPQKRCGNCNRLLFYGYAKSLKIKCPKCGNILFFEN